MNRENANKEGRTAGGRECAETAGTSGPGRGMAPQAEKGAVRKEAAHKEAVRKEAVRIIRLDRRENNLTRPLWEEIFWEDGETFLTYYFSEKCRDNDVFIVEGEDGIRAMLHLNPYRFLMISGTVCHQEDLSYIVGVATGSAYRHRGYMASLLRESLGDLYRKGQPFAFLMPADERIYLPFDFRYVYDRDVYELTAEGVLAKEGAAGKKEGFAARLSVVAAKNGDAEELARFAAGCLKGRYQVFAERTEAYYKRLMRELKSQNGKILLFLENGALRGYCSYDREELPGEARSRLNVQEAVWDEKLIRELKDGGEITGTAGEQGERTVRIAKKPAGQPVIMGRIVNLKRMLSRMSAAEDITVTLRVRDPLIFENNGLFEWRLTDTGSSLSEKRGPVTAVNPDGKGAAAPKPAPEIRAAQVGALTETRTARQIAGRTKGREEEPELDVDIASLTRFVFGYAPEGAFCVEEWLLQNRLRAEPETMEKLKKIRIFGKCFINEIV